jgi:hypothetical protein
VRKHLFPVVALIEELVHPLHEQDHSNPMELQSLELEEQQYLFQLAFLFLVPLQQRFPWLIEYPLLLEVPPRIKRLHTLHELRLILMSVSLLFLQLYFCLWESPF